jgi:murein DD-endopeptidase MepM/ murein hydrolase activator NlpD
VAIPLILAAVHSQPDLQKVNTAAAVTVPLVRYADLTPPDEGQLPQHSLLLPIEEGDTLDSVLLAGGLGRGDTAQLTTELAKSIDVRRLRPGNILRFHYDEAGRVDAVQMKIAGWGQLEALRNIDGFRVTAAPGLVRSVEATVAARIDSSLYEALRGVGEGPQLVQQLVDVFQWDIDFFELRRGDSFSLVVEKRYAGADLVGYGPIKAARFTQRGVTFEAFRHEAPNSPAGYYARNASPLRKQFLRAPLSFSRITSGFSKKRFHPVLNYFRPHYGVDYGAPTGTPVMTTADGVVVEAAYSRGEGNVIRIRHTSRVETSYLHLSKFAKDIKRGTKVTQGDLIGYVGMTGLATGPHLDYRVRDGDKWLDPLTLKSITPDPLRGASLARFRGNVARLMPRLDEQADPQVALLATKRRALF